MAEQEQLRSPNSFDNDSTRSSEETLLAEFDLEDQKDLKDDQDSVPVAAEYTVAARVKLFYLAGYFALNLALTIYNKAVLQKFSSPWLLTAVHTGCTSVGCFSMLLCGYIKLSKLSFNNHCKLVAFSTLYTMNIALSNVSLAMVSVPFHQIIRASCPIFTILIYRVVFGRSYDTVTYITLLPIMFGVGLATYGDYYFTVVGFVLTFLGVFLAAVKTVTTNRLMTGSLHLAPLELLFRMAPLAAVQSFAYAWMTGELARAITSVTEHETSSSMGMALLGNGCLAFVLNVSSFQTNKLAGALTMTLAANVKQCLTILLGVLLFDVRVGLLNAAGMIITLAGAAWYSKVELLSKSRT